MTIDGETKTLGEWIDDPRCLATRIIVYRSINLGWTYPRALLTPPVVGGRKKRTPGVAPDGSPIEAR